MTTARHRAPTPAANGVIPDTSRPGGANHSGSAPGGMWWVAWRQQRAQVAVVLGAIALIVAALIGFREIVIAQFVAVGCDANNATAACISAAGPSLWWSDGYSTWYGLLQFVTLIAPVALGVFVGAPLFAREFGDGTHVFALTQSVGRRKWWAIKETVAGTPLIIGCLALGLVMEWVASTTSYTSREALDPQQFTVQGMIPAAHALVAFGVGIAAGIVTRTTVAALASALVVTGIAIFAMTLVQPHVLPPSRVTAPIDATWTVGAVPTAFGSDPNAAFLDTGYLGAAGEKTYPAYSDCVNQGHRAAREIPGVDGSISTDSRPTDAQPTDAQSSARLAAFDDAVWRCMRDQGAVAEYTDYLPGSMLWPLRWTMTGISVIIAALFLLLSAARLRSAVAKR